MLELASAGAGVMHNRSIEFAKKFDVPVHVRSSFSDEPGTMIVARAGGAGPGRSAGRRWPRTRPASRCWACPTGRAPALSIFSKIAAKNIAVDMIVQNVGGRRHGRHLVHRAAATTCRPRCKAVEEAVKELGAEGVQLRRRRGEGLGRRPGHGHADRAWPSGCSARWPTKGINIQMITTSEIKISVLVAREYAQEALRAVHEAFAARHGAAAGAAGARRAGRCRRRPTTPPTMVARLQRMEELIIDDIALDESQARVTMRRRARHAGPGRPGLRRGGRGGHRRRHDRAERRPRGARQHLSFTVPQKDLDKSLRGGQRAGRAVRLPAARQLPQGGQALGLRHRHAEPHRRGQPACSSRWPSAGINVEMISTSEVRVNVVVDGQQGARALEALAEEFADVMV